MMVNNHQILYKMKFRSNNLNILKEVKENKVSKI